MNFITGSLAKSETDVARPPVTAGECSGVVNRDDQQLQVESGEWHHDIS